MAQVTVRINGYAYTLGCKDGEEHHLQQMAEHVDRRIESIKAAAGQGGEARMLVMAALLMADDLFEMGKSLKDAQSVAGRAPENASSDPPAAAAVDVRLNRRLGRLAKR